MILDSLGKLFYPNQPQWRQRREMKNILVAIVVGIFFALVVVAMIFISGLERR
jgi:hypothetical protein